MPDTTPLIYLQRTSPRHINFGLPFTLTFMYTVSPTEVYLIDIRHLSRLPQTPTA